MSLVKLKFSTCLWLATLALAFVVLAPIFNQIQIALMSNAQFRKPPTVLQPKQSRHMLPIGTRNVSFRVLPSRPRQNWDLAPYAFQKNREVLGWGGSKQH